VATRATGDALVSEVLQKSFLFASIPGGQLEAMAARAELLDLPAGAFVFREGDAGDSLYIVMDGRVSVFSTNDEGGETMLTELGPGESFGEMALLAGEPRSASVRASEGTRLLRLMKNEFDRLLQEQPLLARELLSIFGQRLRSANLLMRRGASREQALRTFMAQSVDQEWPELVGSSRGMGRVRAAAQEAARDDEPVLIRGEVGSEKRAVAQVIHSLSQRAEAILLGVDCAGVAIVGGGGKASEADSLVAEVSQGSALFGHSRGSFSFAETSRMGYLEFASGGTLVIERPERLAPAVQERLREFIETGKVFPLGAVEPVESDVRIIAASDQDLEKAVAEKRFDHRLYELLSAHTIEVPPLRERKRDLPVLVDHLIAKHNRTMGKAVEGITPDALNVIFGYDWDRNFEELEEVIRRGVSLADGRQLTPEQIFIGLGPLEQAGRVNLLRLSWLRRLWEAPAFPAALQVLAVAILALAMGLAFFGPEGVRDNPALPLFWAIGWPALALSIFFFGRLSCAVCPMGAVGRGLQGWWTLGRKVPLWLRNGGPYMAVAGFALIIWVEQATDMVSSGVATGFLLLAIVGGAVIAGVIFERSAWCRYLCPLGRMIGAYARLSALELRSNNEICTADCQSHACFTGSGESRGCPVYEGAFSLRDNEACILCGRCVKNCANRSVRLNLRMPLSELWSSARFSTATAVFAPVLVGTVLAIELRQTGVYDPLLSALDSEGTAFAVVLMASILAVGATLWAAALAVSVRTSLEATAVFRWFAFSVLPLALAGEVAHQMWPLLTGAGDIVPAIGNLLGGQDWGDLTFSTSSGLVRGLQYALVALGAVGSLYVGRRLISQNGLSRTRLAAVSHQLAVVGLLSAYVVVFLFS
jgi:transcriptional regulator with AAA-type ATPase domain/polyferredoxin